jgi:hypothetical protein
MEGKSFLGNTCLKQEQARYAPEKAKTCVWLQQSERGERCRKLCTTGAQKPDLVGFTGTGHSLDATGSYWRCVFFLIPKGAWLRFIQYTYVWSSRWLKD